VKRLVPRLWCVQETTRIQRRGWGRWIFCSCYWSVGQYRRGLLRRCATSASQNVAHVTHQGAARGAASVHFSPSITSLHNTARQSCAVVDAVMLLAGYWTRCPTSTSTVFVISSVTTSNWLCITSASSCIYTTARDEPTIRPASVDGSGCYRPTHHRPYLLPTRSPHVPSLSSFLLFDRSTSQHLNGALAAAVDGVQRTRAADYQEHQGPGDMKEN